MPNCRNFPVLFLVLACLLGVLIWWSVGLSERSAGIVPAAERGVALSTVERLEIADVGASEGTGARTRVQALEGLEGAPDPVEESSEPQPPQLLGRVLTAALMGDQRASSERLIRGATVTYGPAELLDLSLNEEVTEVQTDAEGRFALPVRIGGTNRLSFSAQGHISYAVEAGPVRLDLDLGDIVLQAATVISGRVQDVEGSPIAEARILRHDPSTDELRPDRWDAVDQVLAVTDEEGTFAVPVAPKGALFTGYALAVHHTEFRPKIHTGELRPDGGTMEPVVITLEAGAVIRGQITGLGAGELQSGGPLVVGIAPRNRLLYIQDDWDYDSSYRRVEVDREGRFKVGGLEDGEPVLLAVWTGRVQKDLYSHRRSVWKLATPSLATNAGSAGAAGYVELPYAAPARATARLVDMGGRPIGYAAIGANLPVQVRSSGQTQEVEQMAPLEDGAVEWVCTLDEASWEGGSDFFATVETAKGEETLRWGATSGALRRGEVFDFGDVVLRSIEGDTAPKRRIAVNVVDASGKPLADVYVACRQLGESRYSWQRSNIRGLTEWSVVRSAEHEFGLTELLFGTEHLGREARESAEFLACQWRRAPKGLGSAVVTLRSPEIAQASIAVTYAGVPLAGAILVLNWLPDAYDSSKSRHRREATPKGVRTDGLGRWSRERILPGNWRAYVFHPQLRMPEAFDFALTPGPNSVELARSPTALIGRVVDDTGSAIPGALVRTERGEITPLVSLHERDAHRMTPRLGGSRAETPLRDLRYTRAGGDGSFRLDGVTPDEEIKAIATAPGYVMATSDIVRASPGETLDVGKLRLMRAGALSVLLDDGMDGDVNLRRVFEETEEGAEREHATPIEHASRWSSIFDQLTMDDVPPGEWEVKVTYKRAGSRDPESEYEETITVRAGETTVIDPR